MQVGDVVVEDDDRRLSISCRRIDRPQARRIAGIEAHHHIPGPFRCVPSNLVGPRQELELRRHGVGARQADLGGCGRSAKTHANPSSEPMASPSGLTWHMASTLVAPRSTAANSANEGIGNAGIGDAASAERENACAAYWSAAPWLSFAG